LTTPLDHELRFSKVNLKEPVNIVVKNALAFGGVNAAIIFKRI
jgi:3-oxoacyl-(acyl-carrier-protein) synthase